MKAWEKFEKEITKFLNFQFPNLDFTNEGQSDSTKSDILVKGPSSNPFYIEAKSHESQSGQIVIVEDNDTFILSTGTRNPSNIFNSKILSIINKYKYKYTNITQSATAIEIDSDILYQWIIRHYQGKDCQWIITSNKQENFNKDNVCLFPIKDIKQYFDVYIVMRRKKSGSRNIPKKDFDSFIANLNKSIPNCKTEIICDKLYVNCDSEPKDRYIKEQYYLSSKGKNLQPNQYIVKKLSSTNNINIMFNITLKNNINFKEKEFLEYTKNYTT